MDEKKKWIKSPVRRQRRIFSYAPFSISIDWPPSPFKSLGVCISLSSTISSLVRFLFCLEAAVVVFFFCSFTSFDGVVRCECATQHYPTHPSVTLTMSFFFLSSFCPCVGRIPHMLWNFEWKKERIECCGKWASFVRHCLAFWLTVNGLVVHIQRQQRDD